MLWLLSFNLLHQIYNAFTAKGDIWEILNEQTGYSYWTRFIIQDTKNLLFDLHSVKINNARAHLLICGIYFDFHAPINEDLFKVIFFRLILFNQLIFVVVYSSFRQAALTLQPKKDRFLISSSNLQTKLIVSFTHNK